MIPTLFIMAAWIPIVWGQGSISLSVVAPTSVTASAATTLSTTLPSSFAPPATSSAVAPRLIFDRIETLVACDSAEVSWEVFGIQGGSYEVSLFAIDSDSRSSSSAPPSTSSSISARSVAAASSSSTSVPVAAVSTTSSTAPRIISTVSSAGPSTMLVGRDLYPRQSRTTPTSTSNVTIATDHSVDEPYAFTVTLPAGSYYMIATMNDPLRTTAMSNLFTVIERNDTSCLVGGGRGSSVSAKQTTTAGGVVQTPGAGAESNEISTTSGPSGGAIAGIVIGVLGGLALLAFFAFFCMRKRRRQQGRGRGGDFASSEMRERGPDDRFSALPSASSEEGQYNHQNLPIAAGYSQRNRRDSDPDEKDVDTDADVGPASGANGQYSKLNRNQPGLAATTTESPWSETSHGHNNGEREILASPELPPSISDRRRQSGPPVEVEQTHTLVPKSSMQGIIGKSSSPNSTNHSRSSSTGGSTGAPAANVSGNANSSNLPPVSGCGAAAAAASGVGAGVGLGRSTSTKRKPVPSLGPELRGELQKERERKLSQSSQRKPSVGAGTSTGAGSGGAGRGEARRSYTLTADPLPKQPQ